MTSTTVSPSLIAGVLQINADEDTRVAPVIPADPNLQDKASNAAKCLPTSVTGVLPWVQPVAGTICSTAHGSMY